MSRYHKNSILIWLILIGVAYGSIAYFLDWNWLLVLLIATNISTFLVMGYDKMQASMRGARTPEVVFYLMTLLGGSVGMLAGMYVFRHKTRKASFQFFVGLMIILQIVFVLYLQPDLLETIQF